MSTPDPIKQAWQGYGSGASLPRLEDIQTRAGRFDRHIRIRNGVEYAACLLVIVMFSLFAYREPSGILRLAYMLTVCGTCFVMWQLRRRASVPQAPAFASLIDLVAHHRLHLARQRDALKTVWLWYLLPFVPGQLLYFAAAPDVPGKEWAKLVSAMVMVVIFSGAWWLNQRGAARLQKAIDELDGWEGDEQ